MKKLLVIATSVALTCFVDATPASQGASREAVGVVELARNSQDLSLVQLSLLEVDGKRLAGDRHMLKLAPGKHVIKLGTMTWKPARTQNGRQQTASIEIEVQPGQRYVLAGVPESKSDGAYTEMRGLSGISVNASLLER